MQSKDELRTKFKNLRKKCDLKIISNIILTTLKTSKIYHESQNILIFYPLEGEVDLTSLIEDKNKSFFLPKCKNKEIKICAFNSETTLKCSSFGIMEPEDESIDEDISKLDLVIAPCVAYDLKKYRLGYGGGYYDRFLPKLNKNCKTIVTGSKICCASALPIEKFDLPFDFVLNEDGIF